MITTLLKRELKAGYKLLLIFIAVLTLYGSMIVAMYDPKLGDSLRAMAEGMPEIFAAFGMLNVGTTLLEFVAGYLYGMLLIGFPLVFVILCASRMMARYVDRGSMAYLLATPHKRSSVALTEAAMMLFFLVAMAVYVTGLIIAVSEIMFPGALDIGKFLLLSVGWLALLVFLGGVCFCSACIFSESKLALGIGGGLCIAFLLMKMVSQVNDKFEVIQWMNPLTLFNPTKIIAGESSALWLCAVLLAAGLALYGGGIAIFSKKDLNI